MTDAHQNGSMPDRIAVDAKGYGWRVWDDEDHWSMVPTNPDNSPIPQPVTWFVKAELLGRIVDWLGAPAWTGPQLPIDLARDIDKALRG